MKIIKTRLECLSSHKTFPVLEVVLFEFFRLDATEISIASSMNFKTL